MYKFIRKLLHIGFLIVRPLTLGARAIMYDKGTNSIYLIKHTYQAGWSLPGGGVEVGQSGVLALQREVEEETGMTPVTPILKSIYHNETVSNRYHVLVFLVNDWILNDSLKVNSREISDGKWFDVDSLPADVTLDSLKHINEFLS